MGMANVQGWQRLSKPDSRRAILGIVICNAGWLRQMQGMAIRQADPACIYACSACACTQNLLGGERAPSRAHSWMCSRTQRRMNCRRQSWLHSVHMPWGSTCCAFSCSCGWPLKLISHVLRQFIPQHVSFANALHVYMVHDQKAA